MHAMTPGRWWVTCLYLSCFALLSLGKLMGQSGPPATATVVVEIQCKPATTELWRAEFEKEIVPSIREAIQKGDAFTGFTYFESPLPAQNVDFILVFELKSFASMDLRRVPPHYEVLYRRLGTDRANAVLKESGSWEQRVTVSIFRSYKVQP